MTDERIEMLVLQEFRLTTVDADGAVARIVDATSGRMEPVVPLLTSIDDRRDVATIRSLHDGDAAEPDPTRRVLLGPLVSRWEPESHYVPRILESSQSPPTHYRLAVTESGINDEEPEPAAARTPGGTADGPSTPFGLLWIGRPVATHAGLLVLVGDHGVDVPGSDPRDWPLPMSRSLGVRIYDSRA